MADHGAPSDAIVSTLSPQNRHRRRRSEQDSSSKSSLTDLGDDLLMEILQRLRTAKDAFLCSSVCKNWYDIIFSPRFISRFVTCHANRVARKNYSSVNSGGFESSISLVIRNRDSRNEAIILPENPLSEFQTLDFTSVCEEIKWVQILSSCHDLLLCIASIEQRRTFFICNPVTMKGFCLSLPEFVREFNRYDDNPFALVLEPYCSRDSQGGCILNAGFRYRIMHVDSHELDDSSTHLPIKIYCSESGEFIEDSLFGEEFMKEVCSNLVVYNGKVHWCNGGSILAYDPFRIRIDGIKEDNTEADAIGDHCFIIKCPDRVRESHNDDAITSYKLGVCRGLLRLIHVEFINSSPRALTIWDLEDYNRGKWSVERKFCLNSLVLDDHPLFETLEEALNEYYNLYEHYFSVVAPHPCDEDLVYLSFNGIVSLCNLERKELNVVAEFSNRRRDHGYDVFDRNGNPIVIPWWPTPISSLQ